MNDDGRVHYDLTDKRVWGAGYRGLVGGAIAKIADINLYWAHCRQHGADFVLALPTNLYGPGDNFHPEPSHVIPALIRRLHEAKVDGDDQITVWGGGTPMRGSLYADDGADAILHNIKRDPGECHLNLGTGADVTPRKVIDVSRIKALGRQATIDLETGLAQTYDWYLRHIDEARAV
jgi:GDP-L-fucose synthase